MGAAQAKKSASKARKVAKRAQNGPRARESAKKAIVVAVPPASQKPWLLNLEEVTILTNAVCRGATADELKFCLATARRYQLDPFQKQIWFVKRWDSQAISSDGKKGSNVWTPQVSIDGLCYQAASHHPDYGSFSEPEYGPMMEIKFRKNGEGPEQKLNVPEWARIEAWKKGAAQPTVVKVWWSEIYDNVDYAPLVRRMPRLMLAKCAKAQAIRAAYPKKTSGLLIPEESQGREFTQMTPSGRPYSVEEPENPHLSQFEEREKEQMARLTEPQREIAREKVSAASAKAPQGRADQAPEKPATPAAEKEGVQKGAPSQNLFTELTYSLLKNGSYLIDGPGEVKKANRDLLAQWYDKNSRAIVVSPETLGKLISQFEKRKVPFHAVVDVREPGADG